MGSGSDQGWKTPSKCLKGGGKGGKDLVLFYLLRITTLTILLGIFWEIAELKVSCLGDFSTLEEYGSALSRKGFLLLSDVSSLDVSSFSLA